MSPEIEKLLTGCATVASKIRALDAAGYPRAEIARILGKRYQHVRNVLEEPGASKAALTPGMAEVETQAFQYAPPHTYFLEVDAKGSVTLPPEVLDALGAKPGGLIVADLGEEIFTLLSGMTGIRRMRDLISQPHPPGRLLSEELIEDRRREAAIDELKAQMNKTGFLRDD